MIHQRDNVRNIRGSLETFVGSTVLFGTASKASGLQSFSLISELQLISRGFRADGSEINWLISRVIDESSYWLWLNTTIDWLSSCSAAEVQRDGRSSNRCPSDLQILLTLITAYRHCHHVIASLSTVHGGRSQVEIILLRLTFNATLYFIFTQILSF